MKRYLLLFICFPFVSYGQLSVGSDQTICLGDTAQLIGVLSGPATGCTGISDSLITQLAGGNGSAGTIFNVINTSGSSLDITGISQGGTYTLTNELIEVWAYAGDVYANPLPVGAPPYPGWTMVGSAVVNTTGGTSLGYVPITGVTIPTGGTYSFRVQSQGITVSYTNGTGIPGVTSWASDPNITITEGHGGGVTDWFAFSPRCFNGSVHYGGGAAWYDVNSGQMIGSGDTILYSPTQSATIAAAFDCNGQSYTDTMNLTVINTAISTSGYSLCNGPLVLSAPSGFSSYAWNGPSSSQILTVNSPGNYYVTCVTANGQTCQSPPVTIYQGVIPISLSTPDSVFICQGDTVVIHGPPGYTQYAWSSGQTTQSISTTITGNYTLSVIDSNGCTGASNTTTVDISPTTISATTTSYCVPPAATLSVPSGFASYQWYNNGIQQFLGNSSTYSTQAAGNYYCEVVYPTGCMATSNTLMLVSSSGGAFNMTISAVGAPALCDPNGQVQLDAGNFSTFLWNTGETTQYITVNTEGVYTVDVTDSSGCQGTSNPGYEVLNAVNTSSITGSTIPTQFVPEVYSVLPTTGSTYDWYIPGATILSGSGTNAVTLEYGLNSFGNKNMYVIETNVDGCIGDTIWYSVFVFVSSVDEQSVRNSDLIRIIDVLGKETDIRKNTPLFYMYKDGRVEKKLIID